MDIASKYLMTCGRVSQIVMRETLKDDIDQAVERRAEALLWRDL
jgi:spore coat protein CotF